jgi:Holliday junction resolvasome RuvABC endonuclease subunit
MAVIEGYAMGYGQNGRQRGKFDTAELGGCVRLFMYRKGIPMLIVPPNSLKLFATGKGNADKDMMVEAALSSGYSAKKHDDADAFFLYRMGCTYLSGRIRCARHRQAITGSTYIPAKKFCK